MKKEDDTNGYLVLIKAFINSNGDADISIYPDDNPGLRVYSNTITNGSREFQRGPDKIKFEFIDLTGKAQRECTISFDDNWAKIIKGAPLEITLKNNGSNYVRLLESSSDASNQTLTYTISIEGIIRNSVPPKMIIKT